MNPIIASTLLALSLPFVACPTNPGPGPSDTDTSDDVETDSDTSDDCEPAPLDAIWGACDEGCPPGSFCVKTEAGSVCAPACTVDGCPSLPDCAAAPGFCSADGICHLSCTKTQGGTHTCPLGMDCAPTGECVWP